MQSFFKTDKGLSREPLLLIIIIIFLPELDDRQINMFLTVDMYFLKEALKYI